MYSGALGSLGEEAILGEHTWTLSRLLTRPAANVLNTLNVITPPPIRQRSIVKSVSVSLSVCVCVFVCPQSYLRNYTPDLHQIFVHVTYGRGSVLLWQRNNTLRTSGFMNDVIFAHKPRSLDVAAQLNRSAHAALGLAINCAK